MTIAMTMTTTAAATAMVAALATAMGRAQTTIKLSYRNGGGCSWATAGQRLRNVKGKGEDGSNGDGDGRVRSLEAMPPNPQQYFRIIPFWNRVSAPQPHPNTQK